MHFLYFIVNKQSRNSQEVFKKLLLMLPKYKINYEFLITESIEQLDTLLSQLKSTIQPTDIFVVVGGDGSLNQFVTYYSKYVFENSIAYIPAGSGNDFARAHQIPFDTEEALLHLFAVQKKQKLSVIVATQEDRKHLAVNSIGFGIDGLIGQIVESKGKKEKIGARSYMLGIFSGFMKQEKFALSLTVDEGHYNFDHVQLALVANNPSFAGGVYIVPEASGEDDLLEVMIADNVSASNLAAIVSKLLINQSHLSHPKLHSFQSKEIRIKINSSQYAQKDGEVFHQDDFDYHFQTKKLPFGFKKKYKKLIDELNLKELAHLIGVKRNTGFSGVLSTMKVYIDGQEVAKIKQNQQIEIELAREEAILSVTQFGNHSNELLVKDGQVVEISNSSWLAFYYTFVFIMLFLISFFLSPTYQTIAYIILLGSSFALIYFKNVFELKVIYP